MAISEGDKIPAATFKVMGPEGPQDLTSEQLFSGKTVAVFSVPGAFTPTCSAKHLPGFVQKAADLKSKGVDTIACMAVNDPFVMEAWGKDQKVGDNVMMLADGSAAFTKQLGMELDLVDRGLGVRSQRFAMIVQDGTVKEVLLDEAGAFEKSSAESVLAHL